MFITFEGPEGSGKTTVSNAICARLEQKGYPVVHTREPGGTPIAEQIRALIFNNPLDARAEALLFAASRRQHLVEKVWPALAEGKIVICDRFVDSSLAYQGGARGLGVDRVLDINLFAIEGRFPDLTLLFDIDPAIGLTRIAKNQNREVNRLDQEALQFHQTVRQTFLDLAKRYPERYVVIDASQPLARVTEAAFAVILARLGA